MMRFPLTIEQHRPPSRLWFWCLFVWKGFLNIVAMIFVLGGAAGAITLAYLFLQSIGFLPEG